MTETQQNREAGITTPLGDDILLLRDMTMTEELGRLFTIDLELLSTTDNINFEDLLGQKVTVRLDISDDESRFFNGHVSRFSQSANQGSFSVYQATVRPWLWFLTRTSDCRIFQQKTVPDIIKEVFRDHGYTDFEEKLSGSYRTWEYCVQYRETDFNFVSRLMEQEGIYYYFKHEEDKHLLILADAYSSHEPLPGYESIPYYPPNETTVRDEEFISSWYMSKQVQPGIYALNEYDFKRPKANLEVSSTIAREHSSSDFEVYDYPGEYVESGEGDVYVRARIEELHAQYEQAQGQSDARGIMSGGLFELSEYPREDQDREYLIIAATHNIHSDDFESSSGGSGPVYSNSFSVIASQTSFRPMRTTSKPMVQGPQTATIVGPSGEEIHTDEYGRVKLQFHWDRYGGSDENSSCWVRVAQVWAGKNWGVVHIPRIGQEVIVNFLEGDPDRPIVTGRVYNADNMPPYDLPADKTQSGIKTRSSKEGSVANFNEIRFEDKKGEEQLYIHAEKNKDIVVENNKTQQIGNDETLTVGNDRTKTIGNDQKEDVANNKTIDVGVNHTEHIGSNMKVYIGGNMLEDITGARTTVIRGAAKKDWWTDCSTFTGGTRNDTFAGLKNSKNLAATNEVFVGAKVSNTLAATAESFVGVKVSACKAKEIKSTPTLTEIIKTKSEHKCATYLLDAIDKITMEAGTEIMLTCGSSSIKITPGEIIIKATTITHNGKVDGSKKASYKGKLKNPSLEAKK